jgi:hypothetical protein
MDDLFERVSVMVFNATFNNISIISLWAALLAEKTGVPELKMVDRRGRDRMVVGFTTICAISAYHH